MTRRAILIGVALAGCHHHRDTNAPGLVDVAVPPTDVASEQMAYPGDPGERMVMLTAGVLAGGGGRIEAPHGVGDFAAEVTLDWGENERSHNDNASRLFIPRGAIWPMRGWGVTLGWSALRVLSGPDRVQLGPVYAEVQQIRAPLAFGGGWAVQPTNGDHGPQLNLLFGVTYLRARYLIDGGLELHLGYQLKIPTTWVWSR